MPYMRKPKKIPDHARLSLDHIARDFAVSVRGVMERVAPFCDDYRTLDNLVEHVLSTINHLNGRPGDYRLSQNKSDPGFMAGLGKLHDE